MTQTQIIHIHRDAPPKPSLGASCNGCGVCCAAEPCPVSRFFLGQKQGACRALHWDSAAGRYFCSMVISPAQYVSWLPRGLNRIVGRLFAGWLATGEGCDSDSVLTDV